MAILLGAWGLGLLARERVRPRSEPLLHSLLWNAALVYVNTQSIADRLEQIFSIKFLVCAKCLDAQKRLGNDNYSGSTWNLALREDDG